MLTDFRNQEFKVGQTIVYSLRRGSKQWLCEAVIREIGHDFLRVARTRPTCDRELTIRSLMTVVVVPEVTA